MMHHPIELFPFLQQSSVYLLEVNAAPEHAGGLWEHIKESNVLNQLLVLVIIGILVKKFNLFGGIDAKREQISSEIVTLENKKKEALAQLEETKKRTANLKSEVDEILNNARQAAEQLSTQILSDAKTESGKIIDNAKRRVELEQRGAIKELEKRLLNDALQDAREELARSLTVDQQKRSVESFLDELTELKGGSR
jgi:F-type H+-transporting ATPase subunit b